MEEVRIYQIQLPHFINNFKQKILQVILPPLLQIKQFLNNSNNQSTINPIVTIITFLFVIYLVQSLIWEIFIKKNESHSAGQGGQQYSNSIQQINDLKKQIKGLKSSFAQFAKECFSERKDSISQNRDNQNKKQNRMRLPNDKNQDQSSKQSQLWSQILPLYVNSLENNKKLVNYVLQAQFQVMKELKKLKKYQRQSLSSGRPSTIRTRTSDKKLQSSPAKNVHVSTILNASSSIKKAQTKPNQKLIKSQIQQKLIRSEKQDKRNQPSQLFLRQQSPQTFKQQPIKKPTSDVQQNKKKLDQPKTLFSQQVPIAPQVTTKQNVKEVPTRSSCPPLPKKMPINKSIEGNKSIKVVKQKIKVQNSLQTEITNQFSQNQKGNNRVQHTTEHRTTQITTQKNQSSTNFPDQGIVVNQRKIQSIQISSQISENLEGKPEMFNTFKRQNQSITEQISQKQKEMLGNEALMNQQRQASSQDPSNQDPNQQVEQQIHIIIPPKLPNVKKMNPPKAGISKKPPPPPPKK